jgi:hypothetical protein
MTGEKLQFNQKEDWEAVEAAEQWCKDNNVSYGTMQGDWPRGLKRGNFNIAKWRNLDGNDIKNLDGTMTGDMRNGPVFIAMTPACEVKETE